MKKLLLLLVLLASLGFATSVGNSSFSNYIQLNVTNSNNTLEMNSNTTVNYTVNTAILISNGLMSSSCEDAWIYTNTSGFMPLNRYVENCNTANTYFYFKLNATIAPLASDANYELFFTSTQAVAAPKNNQSVWMLYDNFTGSSLNATIWNCDIGTCWEIGESITVTTNVTTTDSRFMSVRAYDNQTKVMFLANGTTGDSLNGNMAGSFSGLNPGETNQSVLCVSGSACGLTQPFGCLFDGFSNKTHSIGNATPYWFSVQRNSISIVSKNLSFNTANNATLAPASGNTDLMKVGFYQAFPAAISDYNLSIFEVFAWREVEPYSVSNFSIQNNIANVAPTFNSQSFNTSNSTAFANETVAFLSNFSDDSNVVNASLCLNAMACVNGSYYNGSAASRFFSVNLSGLGAGSYPGFWQAFDNSSANTNSSNFTLVIASGVQTASLLLNGLASNLQITYGTLVNASVVCSAATSRLYDSLQTPTLVVSSNDRGAQLLSSNLTGGIHLFTGECPGDANFTAVNSSVQSVNVQTQDEEQPPYNPPASGNAGGASGVVGVISGVVTKTVEAVKEITKGVNFGVLAISFGALALLLLLIYRESQN